jgi:hypothetical protein
LVASVATRFGFLSGRTLCPRRQDHIDLASHRPNPPDVADLRLDMMIMRTELSAAHLALSKDLAAVGQRLAALEGKVDTLPSAIANRGA